MIDKVEIASKEDLHIKSKWGVFPLITQPNAIKPSYLFIFLLIETGISKIPGTAIRFSLTFFFYKKH